MKNSQKNIDGKAIALGGILVLAAFTDGKSFIRTIKELSNVLNGVEGFEVDDNKLGYIIFELIYFYIHLTDRIVFSILGDRQRDSFFNVFLDEIEKNMLAGWRSAETSLSDEMLKNLFNDLYKKRQEEYRKYRSFSKETEGLKEDLFYEFERKLAEILGWKNDPSVKSDIHIVLLPLVKKYIDSVEELFKIDTDAKTNK